MSKWIASALLGLIALYRRWISGALPPSCRYTPTCSQYAADAIRTHGPWRGLVLALRRLGRCHPFGGSGADPVPALPEQEACQ